jgi:hypothetical protein
LKLADAFTNERQFLPHRTFLITTMLAGYCKKHVSVSFGLVVGIGLVTFAAFCQIYNRIKTYLTNTFSTQGTPNYFGIVNIHVTLRNESK